MIDRSLRDECISVELSPADASACLELSAAAGWNQTGEDWWMMLTAGRGFGYRAGEALIATALFLPYRVSCGWIAMVLVEAEYRRRGLATALMQKCIGAARSAGMTAMLDATADGREVYSRMGFADGPRITRFWSPGVEQCTRQDNSVTSIQPLAGEMFGDVLRLDMEVMGSSRDIVLSDIMRRAADRCLVQVDAKGVATGFALGRPGRMASQIGPIVASRATDAVDLVKRVVINSTGPLIIDVPDIHEALPSELTALGFRPQRSLVRMALPGARGEDRASGAAEFPDISRMFAIAGPAIG